MACSAAVRIALFVAAVTLVSTSNSLNERKALLDFKEGIDDSDHGVLVNWTRESNLCSWVGVKCDSQGHVVTLDLSSSSLSGEIHLQLDDLPFLETLDFWNNSFARVLYKGQCGALRSVDISSNQLSGTIPAELGGCVNLPTLSLYSNRLSGEIPDFFASFQKLVILLLHNNIFSGSIPKSLETCQEISVINLSNNILTGEIPMVGNDGRLTDLLLEHNKLTGSLPTSLTYSKALMVLCLGHNLLTGELFDFANFTNLVTLSLPNNFFYGSFPKNLNFTWLEWLDLSNNSFSTIPSVLHLPEHIFTHFGQMTVLSLADNRFNGTIPQWIMEIFLLRVLDLSNNQFSGKLPHNRRYFLPFRPIVGRPTYCYTVHLCEDYPPVTLTIKGHRYSYRNIPSLLDLSMNDLEGDLPLPVNINDVSVFTNTSKSVIPNYRLQFLRLSNNRFSGVIPSNFSIFRDFLEEIDLSHNQLTGSIPKELTSLTYLAVFNVSYNRLSGPILDGMQFNTFDAQNFQGNPGLCGTVLNVSCASLPVPPPVSMPQAPSHTSWWQENVALPAFLLGSLVGFGGWIYFLLVVSL